MFAIGTYNQLLMCDVTRETPIYGFRPFAGGTHGRNLVQVLIVYLGSLEWINTNPDDVNLYN